MKSQVRFLNPENIMYNNNDNDDNYKKIPSLN